MNTDKLPFSPHHAHAGKLDRERVHHLRKGTKQLRARLQLLRQLEGHKQDTEQLRQTVKELAKILAGQRDADVMAGLMQELADDCNDAEVANLLNALQETLTHKRLPEEDLKRVDKLVKEISHNTGKLDRLQEVAPDIDRVLDTRLDSLCAAGSALLDTADWEALHDWRKQVKKLMYQFELKPAMTPRDHFVYEHLDELGNGLGKINDLTVLSHHVREQEKAYTRAHAFLTFTRLYALIDERRQELLEHCRTLFGEIRNQ